LPFPSFTALDDAGTGDARRLLARGAEALRLGDPATAWLIADLLVRRRGGAEAMPYLLRASALARLGRAQESRRDLERAAFCGPYDGAVNSALLAVGSDAERGKALERLVEGGEGHWDHDLATALVRSGRRAAVVCSGDADGIALSGWAATPRTLHLTRAGDATHDAVVLAIDRPAGGSLPGFLGSTHVPWPAGEHALAIGSDEPDVLVRPRAVHRPEAEDGPAAHDGRDASREGRSLLVIVPVYDDFPATEACFRALADNWPGDRPVRVVAVDDVTPDARIAGLLDELAAGGGIELVRNRINLGFAASVNRALRMRRAGEDVVLLNADTVVPPDALARLHDILLADPEIGTLTPLSNNGEDTSIPSRFAANPLGTDAEIAALNALAWQANGDRTVAMPNGIGFCMMIAAPLLARQPLLPVSFGRGYYEDVAYCLTAREKGFANLCATGVYVGHHGSRSFQSDKQWLVKRNLKRLAGRFPGYRAEADTFFADDPLRDDAARIERAWLEGRQVLLVLAAAGAAARVGAARLRELSRSTAPMVIASVADAGTVILRGGEGGYPQSLTIDRRQPDDQALLHRLARACDAVVLVDPDWLPSDLGAIARQATNVAATIVTSAPSDRPGAPPRLASRAAIHATSRSLADLWQRHGSTVQPPPAASRPARPGLPERSDVLYLLSADDDGESLQLCTELGRIWQERGSKAASLVAIGADAPAGETTAAAWLGSISADEFAEWFPLAGPGPVLLASRSFGCGDPRLDSWRMQDHPVAWFETGLSEPRFEGRGLALPGDWPAETISRALGGWLERLARSRAA
jgi:GT2 family glycosyltransferase